jgi:tetratricopeptide (TPR) repeat protein
MPLLLSARSALLSAFGVGVVSSIARLAISNDGIKAEGLIARTVDWVFGYDFFISYSHGDGMRLPRRLKERLEHAGFRVFLDQTEYVAGADLRRETRRQVVKSRKIVVIGRAGALKSEWVKREVDVALAHDKIPVILNLNGAVEAAPPDAILATMARERDWLRLSETLDDPDGEPSDQTISELVRGFNHTRQETKRQRIFATAAAVLALTAGVATWQAIAAVRARTVAEAQRDRAERVLDQVIGNANRRVQALSLRIKRERETPRVRQTVPIQIAPAPEPGSQLPLQQANDLITKGAALLASGDFRGSRSQLDQALQILESGTEAQSGEPQWQLARFNLYNGVAKAALKGDDPDEALAALTKCLAFVQDRVTAEPKALEWRERQAVLYQRIGEVHLTQGKMAEAEKRYQEASALWRELATAPSPLPFAQQKLAVSLARLGDLEIKRANTELALAIYKDSVSLLEGLANTVIRAPDLQRELAVVYQEITDALLAAGRPGDALIWAEKDLAISQRVAADGSGPSQQRDLASSYDRHALALEMLGRDAEALDAYSKGATLIEAAVAADDTEPSWQRDAAAMLEKMGKLMGKRDQRERAVRLLRRALSIREGLAASLEEPEWQTELEAAYRRISELMRSMGREEEALETAEQYLLATSFAADGDNSKTERIGRALGTLCWSALLAKNLQRAVWAGRHAVDLAPKLDWVKSNYAHALMLSGERQKAKEIYLGVGSLSPDAAKRWKDQILKDFEEMKKRRLEDLLMSEISAQFTVGD